MKLVYNWKKAWRMASVQVAACAVGFGALPAELQTALLEAIGLPAASAPAVVGALLIAARLVEQPKTH